MAAHKTRPLASVRMRVAYPGTPAALRRFFGPSGLTTRYPFPVLAWTSTGKIVGWNRAATKMFGWSPSEAKSLVITRLVAAQAGSDPLADLVPQSAHPRTAFLDALTKQGRLIRCEWQTARVGGNALRGRCYLTTVRDATQMVRLERERRRLAEIVTAANMATEMDDILAMVRQAAIEVGGLDRAGVWMLHGDRVHGSWGTDAEGNLVDERPHVFELELLSPVQRAVLTGQIRYDIQPCDFVLSPNQPAVPAPEGMVSVQVGLRARGEIIGMLTADNLLTLRPVSAADVEALLPFLDQVSVTLSNARLLHERARAMEHQQRVLAISSAANAGAPLDDILLMIRNAAVSVSGLDRAGIWYRDAEGYVGSWGTDADGNLRDERQWRLPHASFVDEIRRLAQTGANWLIEHDWSADQPHADALRTPIDHAVVPMNADGEILGFIVCDNALSGRRIREDDVRVLVSYGQQGAMAVRNAHLVAERNRQTHRLERLVEVAAAVNAGRPVDDVLRMLRDALIEVGGFDRAGVWWVQHDWCHGAWGTSFDGQPMDERGICMRCSDFPGLVEAVAHEEPYLIDYWPRSRFTDDPSPEPIQRALIPLRAGGKLVGLFSVDNLITGRPFSPDRVVPLLAFAEQGAIALRNARLRAERDAQIERQRRLAQISAATNAGQSLTDILLIARNALTEVCGFDRAGVWYLADGELRGAWGTDMVGNLLDERHLARRISAEELAANPLVSSGRPYAEMVWPEVVMPDGTVKHNVPRVEIALQTDGELVGLFSVDNAISGREITPALVESLLPFAEQTAVAIQAAKLFERLRQAQQALVNSERLRAVGELASGVAHNINNILTAVMGYAELLQQEPGDPELNERYAGIIQRAASDGAEIVRRVQQFARRDDDEAFVAYDLADVARDAVDLLRPMWHRPGRSGKALQVEVDLPMPLPAIGVPSEIREVVVNLVKNAAEAMPAGGTLTVAGRQHEKQVVLEVRDTGVGMDEQTLRKAFEPFFTTKGMALGTGLGLSVAWGTVERHGGRLEVTSAPGAGSTFTMRLPLCSGLGKSEGGPRTPEQLTGLRVLVVDDEEFVANGVAAMLRGRGAVTEVCLSARDAIHRLAGDDGVWDVVVTDHGMSGMSGLELLAVVKQRFPSVRRIVLSGWGASLQTEAGAGAAERIIGKPVRQNDLVAAIQAVLAS